MPELASLGNFADNHQNIYERMVANRSPSTYVVDVPVVVTKVSSRDLRLSFCHIGVEKFWLLQWKVAMTHPNFSQ